MPEFPPAPSPKARASVLRLDVASWHGGWALGVGVLSALALLFASRPPDATLLTALALLAAPALLPLLPGGAGRGAGAIAGWSLLTAAALTLGGGVSGPLGPAAAAPALAGLALRRPGEGVAGACLSAAAASVLQVLAAGTPPVATPDDAAALASGLTALSALAAWGALALALAAAPCVSVDDRLAQAYAARDRAERDALSRARFLAEMSHELRTPLNAIMGFSDIMRQRLFGPIPGRYGEYAELIHQSGAHLADLINDVLDISKIDAQRYELRRERIDPRDPVASALSTVRGGAEAKGVALHASLPTRPLAADADPRALKQIALNLLSNAVKFTPPGGEVTLSLTAAGPQLLELTVADTGVGVGPEELKRLGEPYAQGAAGREVQGTGLGLSLVKALAGLHGGSLLMESRLGEGTAATVRLPVLVPEAAAA